MLKPTVLLYRQEQNYKVAISIKTLTDSYEDDIFLYIINLVEKAKNKGIKPIPLYLSVNFMSMEELADLKDNCNWQLLNTAQDKELYGYDYIEYAKIEVFKSMDDIIEFLYNKGVG